MQNRTVGECPPVSDFQPHSPRWSESANPQKWFAQVMCKPRQGDRCPRKSTEELILKLVSGSGSQVTKSSHSCRLMGHFWNTIKEKQCPLTACGSVCKHREQVKQQKVSCPSLWRCYVTRATEEDRPPSATANNKTGTATAMRDNPDYCSISITISNTIRIILHSE